METNTQNETVRLPLCKSALETMREQGMSYGSQWKVEFFEQHLRCPKDNNAFQFAMLALRDALEKEDGYYLRQTENGLIWEIPTAIGHEETAQTFDSRLRRYAVRSINLRSATLTNPQAQLSEDERRRMESNLEKAAMRLCLISRQQSILKVVNQYAPALLAKQHEIPTP